MNKKIVFSAIFIVIVLNVLGYVFYKSKNMKPTKEPNLSGTAENPSSLSESTSTNSINPMDNKPDINPSDKSNPFSSIKTNPFE